MYIAIEDKLYLLTNREKKLFEELFPVESNEDHNTDNSEKLEWVETNCKCVGTVLCFNYS